MKATKSQQLGVLYVLVVLLSGSITASAAEIVSICTFNCEFLNRPRVHIKFGLPFDINDAPQSDRDQWNTAGFRDQRFNEASAAVAGFLAAQNADVLALTEVGDLVDVAVLRTELANVGANYPHMAVCHSTDNTTGQHVAVLSRFPLVNTLDTIPGREGYDTELDDPETESDTGISKGMRTTFTAHGQTIHLYVIHLASERGGHEQDAQRIAQASLVRRHYLPSLNAGEHVIVAGDLNDKRGEPTLRRIRGRDDVWGDLIQTGLVDYFPAAAVDTRWTYEFQGVRQQIDHILISRSIRDATTGNASNRIVSETVAPPGAAPGGPTVSDHRALIVRLRFP